MRHLALVLVCSLGLLGLCAPVWAQPTPSGEEGVTADENDGSEDTPAPPEQDGESEEEPEDEEGGEDVPRTNMPKAEKSPDGDGFDPDSVPDELFEAMDEMEPERLSAISLRKSYPFVEHDGMFRLRMTSFNNLDLGTRGTSPILPPPSSYLPSTDNPANKEANWYTGTNIRLRYSPTFFISDELSVKVTLDLPDNLLLGSFPEVRSEAPITAMSGNQSPPSGRYDLRIKEAYGEARLFFGVLRAGRMADHWGLGILQNGGSCMDCDHGDFTDRIQLLVNPFDLYVSVSMDFVSEGPILRDNTTLGQDLDPDAYDDINQLTLSIFKKPLSAEERDRQQRDLRELSKPVINGGAYLLYRAQDGDYGNGVNASPLAGLGGLGGVGGTTGAFDGFTNAQARNWETYTVDAWFQLLWQPSVSSFLRVEAELVASFGSVEFVSSPDLDNEEEVTDCFASPNSNACKSLSRDVQQIGLAVETELRVNPLFSFGLDAGYASGSSDFGFGVNDGLVRTQDDLTQFTFDRDYDIDLLLFSEVIGSITNTTYFKPWVQFDFLTQERGDLDRDTLGLRFDILYAFANDADATPSGESGLGIELDTMLFYQESQLWRTDLSYGLLIPLAGFDETPGRQRLDYPGFNASTFNSSENREADIAHTIQARMFWFF